MSLEQQIAKNNELLEALNANFTRLLAFSVSQPETPKLADKASLPSAAPSLPPAASNFSTASLTAVEKEVANAAAAASPAPSAPDIKYDDVRAAVLAAVKDKGRDAVVSVLDSFGVQRADQLKPEQYADFLASLKKL